VTQSGNLWIHPRGEQTDTLHAPRGAFLQIKVRLECVTLFSITLSLEIDTNNAKVSAVYFKWSICCIIKYELCRLRPSCQIPSHRTPVKQQHPPVRLTAPWFSPKCFYPLQYRIKTKALLVTCKMAGSWTELPNDLNKVTCEGWITVFAWTPEYSTSPPPKTRCWASTIQSSFAKHVYMIYLLIMLLSSPFRSFNWSLSKVFPHVEVFWLRRRVVLR
jgi:hypothetical protein